MILYHIGKLDFALMLVVCNRVLVLGFWCLELQTVILGSVEFTLWDFDWHPNFVVAYVSKIV